MRIAKAKCTDAQPAPRTSAELVRGCSADAASAGLARSVCGSASRLAASRWRAGRRGHSPASGPPVPRASYVGQRHTDSGCGESRRTPRCGVRADGAVAGALGRKRCSHRLHGTAGARGGHRRGESPCDISEPVALLALAGDFPGDGGRVTHRRKRGPVRDLRRPYIGGIRRRTSLPAVAHLGGTTGRRVGANRPWSSTIRSVTPRWRRSSAHGKRDSGRSSSSSGRATSSLPYKPRRPIQMPPGPWPRSSMPSPRPPGRGPR